MCTIAKNQCKYWFSKTLDSITWNACFGPSMRASDAAAKLGWNICWGKDERRTTSGPNYRLAPVVVFIYLGRCLDTLLPPDTIRQPVSGWQDVGDVSWSLHCTGSGHGDGDRQIRGVKGMVSGYLDIRSLPHFPPDHSLVFFLVFVFNFCLCTGLVISILSPYFSFLFFGVYD